VSRKSKAKKAPLDQLAQAKLRVALHEAGHFIAANRHTDTRKMFAQAVKILSDNFGKTRQAAVNLFKQDLLFNFP
jgi:hypothetical protein